MTKRYKVVIVIGSGGGGHTATGRALKDACQAAKLNFDFHTMDVAEILGVTITFGEGVYNWLMSSGRARWISTWHNFSKMISSINERSMIDLFRSYLSKLEFDLIITCVPFINVVVADAISTFKPSRPLVTLLSDFENSSDHPWMQDHRQILICGTENAIKQAEALGHPQDRVYGTSGMIVHPSFYEPFKANRREERIKLGLHPDWRTICVLFGGFAPVFLPQVVKIMQSIDEPLNLLLMCGKNKEALEESLKPYLTPPYERSAADDAAAKHAAEADQGDKTPTADGTPVKGASPALSTLSVDVHTNSNMGSVAANAESFTSAEGSASITIPPGSQDLPQRDDAELRSHVALIGFTDKVAFFMHLCDLLVGKPGPGVVSEALVVGLPVVVELNEEHTPPQEKAVARWINEHHVGVVIEDFEDLPYAITKDRMESCKQNVDKIKNSAVFEVPHILAGVLKNTERRHRRIQSATNPKDMAIQIQATSAPSSPVPPSPGIASSTENSGSSVADLELGSVHMRNSLSNSSLHNGNVNVHGVGSTNGTKSVARSSSDGSGAGVVAPEPTPPPHPVFPSVDSVSVNSPSYSDAIFEFEEPLRLDDEFINPFRIFINASGRWGHDVIKFAVSNAAGMESDSFEITLSTGYYVTWLKELVISSGETVRTRLQTKNDDHGPKTFVFKRDEFPSGSLRLDFFKAGFLGVKTHAYRRYLDVHWCCGKTLHFLWQRERYSHNQRDG